MSTLTSQAGIRSPSAWRSPLVVGPAVLATAHLADLALLTHVFGAAGVDVLTGVLSYFMLGAMTGLWIVAAPTAGSLAALTPVVVLMLVLYNLANAGAEATEAAGADGDTALFTAARFTWLAAWGLPVAVGVAMATGRAASCVALIVRELPIALPVFVVTMTLYFVAGVLRTRAKGGHTLTACTAAFSTPLAAVPVFAMALDALIPGLFPTTTGAVPTLVGACVVITGAAWLGAIRRREP